MSFFILLFPFYSLSSLEAGDEPARSTMSVHAALQYMIKISMYTGVCEHTNFCTYIMHSCSSSAWKWYVRLSARTEKERDKRDK